MTKIVTEDDGSRFSEYEQSKDGFRQFLRDLADELFVFPGYREHQDEIHHEILEAFLVDGYNNVIVEGPTGIGKSPINVGVGNVFNYLFRNKNAITEYFPTQLSSVVNGKSFYTTPQKSLRNQLANDDDLQEFIAMLKGRRDYICEATGDNCSNCEVRSREEESCMTTAACTYWNKKVDAMNSSIAAITFAMLIVDNYLPVQVEKIGQMSFKDRDVVVVDEGHNSESQSSSLFAGFTVSPWSCPPEVFKNAGENVDWGADRFHHVEDVLHEVLVRCTNFIDKYEHNEQRQSQVEQCENLERKLKYAMQTHADGRGWVVNIDEVAEKQGQGTTKKIEVKPVRVNEFLNEYVWSRGRNRLITSATIPFRANVDEWAERIGLDGKTKFVSKPTPFPEEHRLIHLNTMVGEMSASSEDENWPHAMNQIKKISSHHDGENGLIHSVSYPRAKRVQESLGAKNVMIDEQDLETDAVITKWQNSDKDILVSPTMTEGVDLHGDKCRWQVLLKAPFAYVGDSRVDYLLNEEYEWDWYFEEAGIDIIQAVGRAVRGPEPEEAASFYIIDEKFENVMHRTTPPNYFVEAVRDDPPQHWSNPDAAPWR